jgi:catechol 2,3-dioxygenase-like lactoylglutathione lyase family enzyme
MHLFCKIYYDQPNIVNPKFFVTICIIHVCSFHAIKVYLNIYIGGIPVPFTTKPTHLRLLGVLILSSFFIPLIATAEPIFSHVHMRVPDTEEAAAWHQELLGGETRPGGPGPFIHHVNGFVGTMSNDGEIAPPSDESVIDHFGIAVTDAAATIAKAREMGAVIHAEPYEGITAPVVAFFEDPWGVKIEVMEDPVYLGINHIHLFAADADSMKDWFLEVFGGELIEERGKGMFHTILYGRDTWVQVTQSPDGQRAPSRNRAIDHMGFTVDSLDDFRGTLKDAGYEPYLERPNPPGSDLMFFIGPEGIHFEIQEVVE